MKRDRNHPDGVKGYHARFRTNHDSIMAAITAEPLAIPEGGTVPLLRQVEVMAIQDERLSRFFWRELNLVV